MKHSIPLLLMAGMVGIGSAAGLGCPPVAHATPQQDAEFLYLGGELGMTYDDASVAIAQGKALCTDMDDGFTPGQAVGLSMTYYGLDYDYSVKLTAMSILVYCPWHDTSKGEMV